MPYAIESCIKNKFKAVEIVLCTKIYVFRRRTWYSKISWQFSFFFSSSCLTIERSFARTVNNIQGVTLRRFVFNESMRNGRPGEKKWHISYVHIVRMSFWKGKAENRLCSKTKNVSDTRQMSTEPRKIQFLHVPYDKLFENIRASYIQVWKFRQTFSRLKVNKFNIWTRREKH